jgi:hypothetical protein
LTQLRLEVEQLGDVLPTSEERSRQTIRTNETGAGEPADPAADTSRRSRRTRGRRGPELDAPS